MNYSKKKILIVDDDIATQQIISTILRKDFKIESKLASEAKEAFRMMKVEKPDLVILDLQMPIMDGYTALLHMRSENDFKDIPVIPCTALGNKHLIASLYKLDIEDYIIKPIMRHIFVEKIVKAFNNEKPFDVLENDLDKILNG